MPQSLANVLMHFVWSTKHREPWLTDEVRPRFHGYLLGVLQNLGCPSLETNSEPDHVHILCAFSRTITIAKLVEQVKTSTSAWIKTLGPWFAGFCWQGGYAVFSVCESQVPSLRRYIQNQREHHRGPKGMSFQDELREMLRKHRVDFDERYLWE
jgi:putative transposase